MLYAILFLLAALAAAWTLVALAHWHWLLGVLVFLLVFALMHGIYLAVWWLLVLPVDRTKPIEKQNPRARWTCRAVAGFLCVYGGLKPHIGGLEKLPTEGRFLYVSNHQSGFDPLMVIAYLHAYNISFISKPSNMKNRLVGKATLIFEHESNGRDETASRSWNKISIAAEGYISPYLMAHAKYWIPIVDGQYNRDILRYSGLYQAGFQAVSYDNKWVLDMTLVKRKGWDFNFNTIVQLGYRINHNSNQFIMLQYYNGYGECLLDYNQYHSRLRIGLLIRPKFFSDF